MPKTPFAGKKRFLGLMRARNCASVVCPKTQALPGLRRSLDTLARLLERALITLGSSPIQSSVRAPPQFQQWWPGSTAFLMTSR